MSDFYETEMANDSSGRDICSDTEEDEKNNVLKKSGI